MKEPANLIDWARRQLTGGIPGEILHAKLSTEVNIFEAALTPVLAAMLNATPEAAAATLETMRKTAAPAQSGEFPTTFHGLVEQFGDEHLSDAEIDHVIGAAQSAPVLSFELVLTDRTAFLERLRAWLQTANQPLVIESSDSTPETSSESTNSVSVIYLPFIPAVTIRLSYHLLCQLAQWSEVVSFGPDRPLQTTPGSAFREDA